MAELFDQANASSIEAFGRKLLKSTLRERRGVLEIPDNLLDIIPGGRARGSFGGLVEKYYYGINPGNESRPDFFDAGVELKTTPLKKLKKGEYSAKERLVLNIINYVNEAEKTFETSSFYTKNNLIMLLGYLYEKGIALGDLKVMVASLLDFERLTELDKKIIREDWEKINFKIRESRAHELSEGDTLYLAACTKSSDSTARTGQYGTEEQAKPRAYSFKAGYMTKLLREFIAKHEEEGLGTKLDSISKLTFEEQVLQKLSKYYGMTDFEIEGLLKVTENRKAKGYVPTLVRRMLGVSGKTIPEFEAAEIVVKTVRLEPNGTPAEAMSFPAFQFTDIIEQKWDADESMGEVRADFQNHIEKRFLIVVFQEAKSKTQRKKEKGAKILQKAFFWTMPFEDRLEVKKVWGATIKSVQANNHHLPGSKENHVAHIRPHATKGVKDIFPDGSTMTRQGFWLNKEYIKAIIEKN